MASMARAMAVVRGKDRFVEFSVKE